MTDGTVKFFDAGKHFGFINGDDGKSYYFHESQVEQGTRVTDGDKVSFTPAQGERGPKAEHVVKKTTKAKESEPESEESEGEASEATEEELEEEIAESEEEETE